HRRSAGLAGIERLQFLYPTHGRFDEFMKRALLASRHLSTVQNDLPAIAGGDPIRSRERRLIFGSPTISEAEITSVIECLRSNWIGTGPRVEELERRFAHYKQVPYAAAT